MIKGFYVPIIAYKRRFSMYYLHLLIDLAVAITLYNSILLYSFSESVFSPSNLPLDAASMQQKRHYINARI